MNRALPDKKISRSISVFIVLFSIVSFSNARIDFSYDYSVYLYYHNQIYLLDLTYLNRSVASFLPMPYVFIPPSAIFEYGYSLLAMALGYVGLSAAGTFTAIATASIAIRAFVIDRVQASSIFNVLISACYITLFEANAVRVGIASSFVLVALLLFVNQKYLLSLLVAALSFLLHVQALIYVVTFVIGMAIYLFSSGRPYVRILFVAAGLAATMIIVPAIDIPYGTKVDDYLLRTSGATGFNVISISSLVAMAVSTLAIPIVTREARGIYSAAWIASLFAFSQATVFLIFGGAFADIGVRLWQFAFLVFAVTTVLLSSKINLRDKAARMFFYSLYSVYFCALVQSINVLFRYPLSNFFYPFLPYRVIDYVVI